MEIHKSKAALSIILGVSILMLIMAATFAFFAYVDWAYQPGVQLSLESQKMMQQPSNLTAMIASKEDIESIKSSCLDLAKNADIFRNSSKYQSEQLNRFFHEGLFLFFIIFLFKAILLLFAYFLLRKTLK